MAEADTEIEKVAVELVVLKTSLGGAYWQDATVCQLQDRLRRLVGSYDAWGEDKPAMHRRARQAAAYQARFARLLWPGGDED
ncbi:MAG: hypothetical protein U1E42_02420 [Rhodospirillales bacterium]